MSESFRSKLERTMEGWSVPIVNAYGNARNKLIHPGLPRERDDDKKGPDELFLSGFNVHYKDSPLLEIVKKDKQLITVPNDIPNMLIECPAEMEITNKYHLHPGGESKYLYEKRNGYDIDMVSVLGPNLRTSPIHFHLPDLGDDLKTEIIFNQESIPGVELYRVLYGMAIIHHTEDDEGYATPSTFYIEPGVGHWLEGGPKGAIFALRMKFAALYPESFRHVRFEMPKNALK